MTDIPPMVERCARAIARWHAMQTMGDEIAWIYLQYDSPEAWVEEEWRQHEGEARAVIEAMREPSPEVVGGVREALCKWFEGPAGGDNPQFDVERMGAETYAQTIYEGAMFDIQPIAEVAITAMIDAALGKGT